MKHKRILRSSVYRYMNKIGINELQQSLLYYDRVVLLPDDDKEWNDVAIDVIKSFIAQGKKIKTYIVCESKGEIAEKISISQCKEWLDLYRIYEFSPNFIVISCEKPYGRKWRYLLEQKCLTKEQMILSMMNM